MSIVLDDLKKNFDPDEPQLIYTDTEHGRYWYPKYRFEGDVIFECDATEYRCGEVVLKRRETCFLGKVFIPYKKETMELQAGFINQVTGFYTDAYYKTIKGIIDLHEKWLSEQFEKALEMPDSGDKNPQPN